MKIELSNISKTFDKFNVLTDVSMRVEPGTIHGLLGSNGAGKTTLMKIIAGIIRADHGEVKIDNELIFENPSVKQNVIFLQDIPYFFKGHSLNQMANFYKSIYTRWSESRYLQLVNHLGLDPNKSLNEVSKGMKRQAAFILAYSSLPQVLVLDEPFDGLDPIVRKQVKNIMIQDIASYQMTVLASSHNLREMEDLCDIVTILHDGKIVYNNTLESVKNSHCKVQMAFKTLPSNQELKHLNIVYKEEKGRIVTCIIEGDIENIEEKVTRLNPLMYDILPLTLEEIFTYEMRGTGYEIKNIIVE